MKFSKGNLLLKIDDKIAKGIDAEIAKHRKLYHKYLEEQRVFVENKLPKIRQVLTDLSYMAERWKPEDGKPAPDANYVTSVLQKSGIFDKHGYGSNAEFGYPKDPTPDWWPRGVDDQPIDLGILEPKERETIVHFFGKEGIYELRDFLKLFEDDEVSWNALKEAGVSRHILSIVRQ